MLGLTLGVCAVHTALIGILCALLVFLERTVFFRVWAFLAGRPGAVLMENAPGGGKLWEPIFDTGVLRIEDASFLLSVNAPLLILGGALAGFVFGAIFQRFGGARAVSSLPVLLVWVFLLLPNLVLPDTFTQAVSPYQLPLLVLVLSAGMAWSVWSLLHAVIRE